MSTDSGPSRRDFLKIAGFGLAGVATGGAVLREGADWINYNATLAKEVELYSKSFGFREEKVTARCLPVELTDIKDQRFKVVVDSKVGIPLMITDEHGEWISISRKELGTHCDRKFGVLIDNLTTNHSKIIKSEFGLGALSNDWGWRVNGRDFNFSGLRERIEICQRLGINDFNVIAIIGAGVPKNSIPEEFFDSVLNKTIPKDRLFNLMADCIRETMTPFKGMKPAMGWSVINEPFKRGPWPDPYRPILGEDYVEKMYRIARETDPDAELILNIPDAHWSGGEYTQTYLKLVERLKSLGLVDIVGQQMHLDSRTMGVQGGDVQRTISSYGVKSIASEFDLNISDLQGSEQERALEQARYAEMQYDAILPVVYEITDWGICVNESWQGEVTQPNDWNADESRRPSYYTKLRAILKFAVKPEQRTLVGL